MSNIKKRPIHLNKHIFFILMLLALNSGCTNKQIYEHIQKDALRECRKLPATEYQQCVKSHSESFESYTQERAKLNK